jgi:hypothetical protein
VKATDKESNREFVERWKRVGPLLEEIRQRKLGRFRYEDNVPLVESMLQMAFDYAVPRTTSGLVELQRLMAKEKQ